MELFVVVVVVCSQTTVVAGNGVGETAMGGEDMAEGENGERLRGEVEEAEEGRGKQATSSIDTNDLSI